MLARFVICAIIVGGLGCAGQGGVSLSLELPADSALDPLDERVAGLTLSVLADDTTVYSASRAFGGPGQAVDFGRVPVGTGLSFELAGRTSAARVIAFGRSAAPIDVTSDGDQDVAMRVRKPYVYVAGADELLLVDSTQEPGHDYARGLAIGEVVSASAVSPDGATLVLVAGNSVRVIQTTDHVLTSASAALVAPAVHVAISPDSRWAAISHTVNGMGSAPRGVSIVDLAALVSSGSEPVRFVPTSSVAEVSLTNDTAWALQDPQADFSCAALSSLLPIDLGTAQPGAPIELGGPAVDLVASGDSVFVAMSCADSVVRVANRVLMPTPVLTVQGPSTVTASHGRVWAMGHLDEEFAHLILASARPDGSDLRTLDFPTLEERAVATALVGPGQDGLIRMTADLASAFDIAVLPDGEHVAILIAAVYVTDPIGNAGGGQPVLPVVRMITYEYQLAQLATGLAAQRMRTSCAISWDPGALLDSFECARAPGQDVSPVAFVPTRLTALFGSR